MYIYKKHIYLYITFMVIIVLRGRGGCQEHKTPSQKLTKYHKYDTIENNLFKPKTTPILETSVL